MLLFGWWISWMYRKRREICISLIRHKELNKIQWKNDAVRLTIGIQVVSHSKYSFTCDDFFFWAVKNCLCWLEMHSYWLRCLFRLMNLFGQSWRFFMLFQHIKQFMYIYIRMNIRNMRQDINNFFLAREAAKNGCSSFRTAPRHDHDGLAQTRTPYTHSSVHLF